MWTEKRWEIVVENVEKNWEKVPKVDEKTFATKQNQIHFKVDEKLLKI